MNTPTSRVASLAIALALFATMMGFSATSASARVDEEMSQRQAGRVYLAAICSSNDAAGVYSRRVFRGRNTIYLPEIRRRLPELRRASAAYSRALANTARDLFNPPAAWPATVSNSVRSISNKFLAESNAQARASAASTGIGWIDHTDRADEIGATTNRLSRRVRALLDLPPPGRGC